MVSKYFLKGSDVMPKSITKEEKVVIVSIKMANGLSSEVVVNESRYNEVLTDSLDMNPAEIKIHRKNKSDVGKLSWLQSLTRPGRIITRNILLSEGFTASEASIVMRSYDPETDIKKIFSHYPAKAEMLIGKIFGYQIAISDIAEIS